MDVTGSARAVLTGAAEAVLELVFPTRCAGCDLPGDVLCDACREALVGWSGGQCRRCGAGLAAGRCRECRGGAEFAFAEARSAGPLAEPLSRVVTIYKDAGERRLASTLGGLVADAASDLAPVDAVVGVPASRAAVARRGFDHGALLAVRTAERLGVRHVAPLRRIRGRDQRRLGAVARRENSRDAFFCVGEAPRRVLLVDDVMTTGATLDGAADALVGAGSDRVVAAVAARALSRP